MGFNSAFKGLKAQYTHAELYPHSLSPHYMFCGQIHAPATLPSYVLTHLMNSNFLGIL